MSETKVQKLARQFLLKQGPMTKKSAKEYAGMFKEGKINVPDNYTQQEVSSALELVNTISYLADTNAYENGGSEVNPAKGKAILESQALRSPAIQQQISSMLPQSHEYTQAVQTDMAATNKGTAFTRNNEQPVDVDQVRQQAMSDILNTASNAQQGESGALPQGISVSPSGKSFQYQGTLGNGDARTQPKLNADGSVTRPSD